MAVKAKTPVKTPVKAPSTPSKTTGKPYVAPFDMQITSTIPSTPAPAPSPSAPVDGGGGSYYGSGGGGGGGGAVGGGSAPAPTPMTDTDWFNSDATFRAGAGAGAANLQDMLAQLLYTRNQGYQGVDTARTEWGNSREQAQGDVGEEYASRGLLSSGLYRSALDTLLADYEKQAGQINSQEQDLTQQYGRRDSLAGGIDAKSLVDGNYTALADIYGLLGSKGVQAGTAYNNDLNKLRAESATRATEKLTNTLGW